ncbi:MAG: cation diffusion facilitator family transporter [Acidobacteria bacterium]|nr:cation diffusion facilitator family transporter [Acidobacteriota bacterium]
MHDHADHDHAARPGPGASGRSARGRLALGLVLTLSFAAVEAVGGFLSGSLALMADAVHMLADSAALVLALLAAVIAGRPHTARFTFGFHRAEVLAALANAVLLWLLLVRITWEAVLRLAGLRSVEIDGRLMLSVAVIGFAVNLVVLFVLRHGAAPGHAHGHEHAHEHEGPGDPAQNINLRAALIHVLGDLLGSAAAILAALALLAFGWSWADPAASLAVAALIAVSAWRILREAAEVLLDVAPAGKDAAAIERVLVEEAGIAAVHDLHVWCVTPGRIALAAHVRMRAGDEAQATLARVNRVLAARFEIHHTTIQLEPERGVSDWARLPVHPRQQ